MYTTNRNLFRHNWWVSVQNSAKPNTESDQLCV